MERLFKPTVRVNVSVMERLFKPTVLKCVLFKQSGETKCVPLWGDYLSLQSVNGALWRGYLRYWRGYLSLQSG